MSDPHDTSRISPTAHYTGYVWYRNGLSPAALATVGGRLFYEAVRPGMWLGRRLTKGLDLETALLQRHYVIDYLLDEAIRTGRIGQLVELAAGLSGRGLRFARRYRRRGLTVVEGDLPGMARRKRRLLERSGILGTHHHIVPLNILVDEGPRSLRAALGPRLQPGVPTAVITEGLLVYFHPSTVGAIWRRLADFLGDYGSGLYLADLHLEDETPGHRLVRLYRAAMDVVASGPTFVTFDDAEQARGALTAAGFSSGRLHRPPDFAQTLGVPALRKPCILRIVEATVGC